MLPRVRRRGGRKRHRRRRKGERGESEGSESVGEFGTGPSLSPRIRRSRKRNARVDHSQYHPERRRRDSAAGLRRLPGAAGGDPDGRRARRSRPATATSTPRPPTATRRASARPSPPRGCRARSCSSPPSCGTHEQGHDSTLAAFDASLDRLGLDYVDLYLIHWPAPPRACFLDTWRAFEQIHGEGRRARSASPTSARASPAAERETATRAGGQPDRAAPASSRPTCAPGTPSTASSPRPGARSPRARLLDDETIGEIAARHGKTPAQVILRWHLQLGNIVIPKSVTPERIRENIDVFDFELSDEEMAAIGGSGQRPAAASVQRIAGGSGRSTKWGSSRL